MLKFPFVTTALVLLSLFNAKKLIIRENHDPGNCSRSNHGELILVKDRENRDTILVCTEDDEVFSWKTTDNSKPPGEFFNPGYDCLDILNKNPKSKDGYYWVNFNAGKPKKVYCDMTTDGGGYILFGYINGTVTWGVPSNNETVEPFGGPHWSSEFGDVSVLDFRIQVASDDDMEKTQAHWAFRFKNKRVLKNLMIVDQGGCPNNFPGVGDVSYVKDLMTGEIVSKDFSCSIFGPYSFPSAKVGWTMMNLCLEQPCPYGFAYHWLFPVQVHFSGGFSYVSKANSSSSGSTAFFGCDKGKCCACYGPRGGRDVYCLEECEATNGGTITKHASAWFWVRLNPPRKVWEKCMEFKSEEENGDSAWYKLEGERNIPVKGRCGRSEPLINDGVVVVEKLQDIPAVTGLLAFQKDSQTLNLRGNETWKTLAEEEKITHTVLEMYEQLTTMKESVEKLENGTAKKSETLKMMHTVSEQLRDFQTTVKERVDKLESTTAKKTETLKITQGVSQLNGQLAIVKDQTVKNSRYLEALNPGVWKLVARFSNNDGKNWMKDANFWFDKTSPYGRTTDPSLNQDMISQAFWFSPANNIKITRSDDPTHTALLKTTNNCLNGKTFREFITSFGNFRNGAVWSSNKCLGSCAIKYGGLYQSTTGFGMHSCSSGIQSSNYIGFWCEWSADAAVMMIGGGGSGCGRADHGIGITEQDPAQFGGSDTYADFGYETKMGPRYVENNLQKSYALNLWVR